MPDTKTRLLEAERALDRLEMQIEQYQLHLAELSSRCTRLTRPALSSTGWRRNWSGSKSTATFFGMRQLPRRTSH